jgi:hypothetical protein
LPPASPVDRRFVWIWRAWHRLHYDRPYHGGGMGPAVPGRIAWMTLRVWADCHKLSDGEFALLDACMETMDGVFIQWWVQKNIQPGSGGR